jgi:hypothetical protein
MGAGVGLVQVLFFNTEERRKFISGEIIKGIALRAGQTDSAVAVTGEAQWASEGFRAYLMSGYLTVDIDGNPIVNRQPAAPFFSQDGEYYELDFDAFFTGNVVTITWDPPANATVLGGWTQNAGLVPLTTNAVDVMFVCELHFARP